MTAHRTFTLLKTCQEAIFQTKCLYLSSLSKSSISVNEKVDLIIIPSSKMNLLKTVQKRAHYLISISCIGNLVSTGLWHWYEPLVIGKFALSAGCCSLLAFQCFIYLLLTTKTIGKIEVDKQASTLTVSHLNLFATRCNKTFDIHYSHFECVKNSDKFALLSILDGKYIVSLRNTDPNDVKALIPNNPIYSQSFFKFDSNTLRYIKICILLICIPSFCCYMPVMYNDYKVQKKDN